MESYPGTFLDQKLQNKERKGHSLENIRLALEGYSRPPRSSLPEKLDAFDTFVGYVTFDANAMEKSVIAVGDVQVTG